mmetsp:Transcript_26769/g.49106  ORF Transcript_26769/g.49106 Transcript_26769/m.49106 type:complete len:124 (+) Transcript_26769:1-372(+)
MGRMSPEENMTIEVPFIGSAGIKCLTFCLCAFWGHMLYTKMHREILVRKEERNEFCKAFSSRHGVELSYTGNMTSPAYFELSQSYSEPRPRNRQIMEQSNHLSKLCACNQHGLRKLSREFLGH